jgi:hypothetical protein
VRALMIGPDEKTLLAGLAKLAAEHPVDMPALLERIQTGEGKHRHMQQMTMQTIELPVGYSLTFSIEDGHPAGRCRHMSMSVEDPTKMPHPAACWMVAKELGFWGELGDCDGVWPEALRQGAAINLVQRMERESGQ